MPHRPRRQEEDPLARLRKAAQERELELDPLAQLREAGEANLQQIQATAEAQQAAPLGEFEQMLGEAQGPPQTPEEQELARAEAAGEVLGPTEAERKREEFLAQIEKSFREARAELFPGDLTRIKKKVSARRALAQPRAIGPLTGEIEPPPEPPPDMPPTIGPISEQEARFLTAREQLLDEKVLGVGPTHRQLITAQETLRAPAAAAAARLGAMALAPAGPLGAVVGFTLGPAVLGAIEMMTNSPEREELINLAREDFPTVGPFEIPYLLGGVVAFPMLLPSARNAGRLLQRLAATDARLSPAQAKVVDSLGGAMLRGARFSPETLARRLPLILAEEAAVGLPFDYVLAVQNIAAGRPTDAMNVLILGPTLGAAGGAAVRFGRGGIGVRRARVREQRILTDEALRAQVIADARAAGVPAQPLRQLPPPQRPGVRQEVEPEPELPPDVEILTREGPVRIKIGPEERVLEGEIAPERLPALKPAPREAPAEIAAGRAETAEGAPFRRPVEIPERIRVMSDEELQATRLRDLANLGRAQAEEFGALAASKAGGQRMKFGTMGEGVIGVTTTGAGAFARGRQTQAKNRMSVLNEEALRRGLSDVDEDAVLIEVARPFLEEENIRLEGLTIQEATALKDSFLQRIAEDPRDYRIQLIASSLQARVEELEFGVQTSVPSAVVEVQETVFGEPEPVTPTQGELLAPSAGAEGTRSLAQSERAARSEIEKLEEFETRGAIDAEGQARLNELRKLVNRDQPISGEEIAGQRREARLRAEEAEPAVVPEKIEDGSELPPSRTRPEAREATIQRWGRGDFTEQEVREVVDQAMHGFTKAEEKIAFLKERGADDAELVQSIGDLLGISGGSIRTNLPRYSFRGGKNPVVTIEPLEGPKRLKITTAKLRDMVRDLYGIPEKRSEISFKEWMDAKKAVRVAAEPEVVLNEYLDKLSTDPIGRSEHDFARRYVQWLKGERDDVPVPDTGSWIGGNMILAQIRTELESIVPARTPVEEFVRTSQPPPGEEILVTLDQEAEAASAQAIAGLAQPGPKLGPNDVQVAIGDETGIIETKSVREMEAVDQHHALAFSQRALSKEPTGVLIFINQAGQVTASIGPNSQLTNTRVQELLDSLGFAGKPTTIIRQSADPLVGDAITIQPAIPPRLATQRVSATFDAAMQALEQGSLPTDPRQLRIWAEGPMGEPYKAPAQGGLWTVDELYDAIEGALHQVWRVRREALFFNKGSFREFMTQAISTENLLANRTRSIDITKLQQFSTPLPISEALARAAGVETGDLIVEPTAGTGSLITPYAREDVTILANEIDPRRVAVLERLTATWSATVNVQEGDALRLPLAAALVEDFDLAIGNPPWRTGAKFPSPFASTEVATRFVVQTMKLLRPGGRLAFLMPTTIMDPKGIGFRLWLEREHTIRALIQSPPNAYRSRGTNVESVLMVVDKGRIDERTLVSRVGPQQPSTWDEYTDAIEHIRPKEAAPSARPTGTRPLAAPEAEVQPTPSRDIAPEREPGPIAEPAPSPGTVPPAEEAPTPAGPGAAPAARPERGGVRGRGARPGGARPEPEPRPSPGARPEPTGVGAVVVPEPGRGQPTSIADGASGPLPPKLKSRAGSARRADDTPERREAIEEAERSEIFTPVVLTRDFGGRPHPRLIVETRSLAGAPMPELTYEPHPKVLELLKKGVVSNEQFEMFLRMAQASDAGHGFLNADNVGLGKTREAGLLALEWLYSGRARRILLVSKGRTATDALVAEWEEMMGADWPFEQIIVNDFNEKGLISGDDVLPSIQVAGIYVLDYNNFSREGYLKAVMDAGIDGLIADEAHKFSNIEGSQKGQAWKAFHAKLLQNPTARTAYLTATPGVGIDDLEWAYGLREWTVDGFEDWKLRVTGHADVADDLQNRRVDTTQLIGAAATSQSSGRGMWGEANDVFAVRITAAEQEQIMRELKRKGKFWARDLWRKGVEFRTEQIDVTPEDISKIDHAMELVRDIDRAYEEYRPFNPSTRGGRGIRGTLQFYVKRLMFETRLQAAIDRAAESLAQGEQVVISLINTSGDAANIDPDLALEGNRLLRSAIQRINFMNVELDPTTKGVVISEEIPEALELMVNLEERVAALPPLEDPLQRIKDRFGEGKVAFITGQTPPKARVKLNERFQQGAIRLAVISQSGKEQIDLHDIGTGRRHMYVADFEWGATKFIQELGRVDRTGQVSAPKITVLHSDAPADIKFVGTLASRMRSLGAVSRGGAEATGTEALDEFELGDNVGLQAMRMTYEDLPEADKLQFSNKKFIDYVRGRDGLIVDVVPRRSPLQGAMVGQFLLDLSFMPQAIGKRITTVFLENRQKLLSGESEEERQARRTIRSKGEILRINELSPELTLYEVKDLSGSKFGILEGMITPQMTAIQQARGFHGERQKARRYMTFTSGEDQIAGMVLSPGEVGPVSRVFGKDIRSTHKPETALTDLRAGDRIPIVGHEGETWVLRMRKDKRIQIDGAKMKSNKVLTPNGAAFDPVGRVWFIDEKGGVEKNLPVFFNRFPIKQVVTTESLGALEDAAKGAATYTEPSGGTLNYHPAMPNYRHPDDPRLDQDDAHLLRTRRDVVAELEKALERIIGTGGIRPLGKFKIISEAIRTKYKDDLPVAAHEVGHAIHKMMFDRLPSGRLSAKPLAPFRSELWDLASHVPKEKRTVEGAAIFWEDFLRDEVSVKLRAPMYYSHILGWLEANAPEILNALRSMAELHQLHSTADPEAVIDAEINWRDRFEFAGFRSYWDRIRHYAVTDLTFIERMMKRVTKFARDTGELGPQDELDVLDDMAKLAQLLRGTDRRAMLWIDYGPIDYATGAVDREGPSLSKAFRGLSERQMKRWGRWMVASRTLELMERRAGGETRIRDPRTPRQLRSQDLIDKIRNEGLEEDFLAIDRQYQAFNDAQARYLVDAGLTTAAGATAARQKNRRYIPFQREFEEAVFIGMGGVGRSRVALYNPMGKRIRESGRRILNMYESMIKQVHRNEKMVHRQRVVRAAAKISRMEGAAKFVERLPAPPKAILLEVGRVLEKLGLDPEELGLDPLDTFMFFTAGEWRHSNIIWDIEQGQRVWYEIKDMDAVEELTNIDSYQMEPIVRFAAAFASFFRGATVLAPQFPLRNIWRDQFVRSIQSIVPTKFLPGKLGELVGPLPFEGFFPAILSYLKRDIWWERMQVGAAGGTGLYQALARSDLRARSTDLKHGPRMNVVRRPMDMLWALGTLTENATRLAESRAIIEGRGGTEEHATQEQIFAGGIGASRVSVDFRLRGAGHIIRMLAATTAFWKPAILGYDRMAEEFFSSFHPSVNRPNFWRAMFRSFLKITFPTMVLYFFNKDNPDYWDHPQWMRDMFWLIPLPLDFIPFLTSDEESTLQGQILKPFVRRGDTLWLRWPKPFEYGTIFGAIPERMLAWAQGHDPASLHEALANTIGRGIFSSLLPLPTIAQPLVENLINSRFFFHTPVVPERLRRLPAEAQVTERTSLMARQMARWLSGVPGLPDISPIQLENIMYGYGSSVGYTIGDLIDPMLRQMVGDKAIPEVQKTPADIPFFGVFFARWPRASNEPVNRFWKSFQKNDKWVNFEARLARSGRFKELNRVRQEHGEEIAQGKIQRVAAARLREIGRARALFRDEPGLTKEERRLGQDLLNLEGRDVAAEAIAWPHFVEDAPVRENRRQEIRRLAQKVGEAMRARAEIERLAAEQEARLQQ